MIALLQAGTISEQTQIPLSLVITLLIAFLGAVGWAMTLQAKLNAMSARLQKIEFTLEVLVNNQGKGIKIPGFDSEEAT